MEMVDFYIFRHGETDINKQKRWQGHHVGDPGLYRPDEEVEEWKAKEPLKILEDKKLLTDEEIAEIKEMVEKEIQEACKFAEESPYPDMAEAYTDVFVD